MGCMINHPCLSVSLLELTFLLFMILHALSAGHSENCNRFSANAKLVGKQSFVAANPSDIGIGI